MIKMIEWTRRKAYYAALFAVGVYLLKQYMNGGVCTSEARIDGKVVIVTGGNTGIGKETVKDLVLRGGKIYLACRSLERARQAAQDIQKETGLSLDRLPIMQLDLGSLASIRQFVKEFKQKETKLDILINNAGVMLVPEGKTKDGFETTFGINHLGHFLLTNLLMDLIKASSKARIINVSALLYEHGTMDFDDLMFEKGYSGFYAYARSKLANILFTRELAKRLTGSGITTYTLHPGVIHTELLRDAPIVNTTLGTFVWNFLSWPFVKELWYGAQTTIYCAVDENLENETGKWYRDCQEEAVTKEAMDDQSAQKLWDISVQLVKLDAAEIHPLLK